MKMQPDDPRLTAFALGELEGEEHARVAAAVAAQPDLQAAVAEINFAASHLSAALAAESLPEVEPLDLRKPLPERVHRLARRPARAHLFQFPYVAIGSLAAACFAIMFLLINQPEQNNQPAPALAQTESTRQTLPQHATPDDAIDVELVDAAPAAAELSPTTTTLLADATPPTPAPQVPVPTLPPAPVFSLAASTPAPITENPNPTGVPVHQTLVPAAEVAAGISRDERPDPAGQAAGTPTEAMGNQLAENGPTLRRGASGEAALPSTPSTDGALAAGDANAGYYQDLLGDEARSNDHLRLTFREFGTPRYPGRPATAARPESAPGGSMALANNPTTPDTAAATPSLPADGERSRELDIKRDIAPRLRSHYEESAIEMLRGTEEQSGTLARGGAIPDLETQLRELQQADDGLEGAVHDFVRDNAFESVTSHPTSVFPVVVDAASLVNVRRSLLAGELPARDAVRIDELLNSQTYDYVPPTESSTEPFAAALEVASAPWAPEHRLVRVGLKAREVAPEARPAANFVLLIETATPNAASSQLSAIKDALRAFVAELGAGDKVAITVHSGTAASLVLPTTSARDRDTILAALDSVEATGAATGTTGLQLAYDIARAHFVPDGINRVIFASDGDTRIGEARREAAVQLIDRQARTGIALSALGFGVRDIRDSLLESIAHRGSGEIAFIDTPADASRVLNQRAHGGFTTVARNVKVQVEFNPARVSAWRLIGYEDRVFLREDFDRESLSADVIGAGHTVTALFEIVPVASASPTPAADSLVPSDAEMLTVKVRYRAPDDATLRLQQFSLTDSAQTFAAASADFKFASAVAGLGMILRESPHRGTATLADVASWATAGRGFDRDGSRAAFLGLVERARAIVQ